MFLFQQKKIVECSQPDFCLFHAGIGGFIARTRKPGGSLAAQSRLISRSLSDGAVAISKQGIEVNPDGSLPGPFGDIMGADGEKKRKRRGPKRKSNLEAQFPSYIQVRTYMRSNTGTCSEIYQGCDFPGFFRISGFFLND